jgi:hypothetical protein
MTVPGAAGSGPGEPLQETATAAAAYPQAQAKREPRILMFILGTLRTSGREVKDLELELELELELA